MVKDWSYPVVMKLGVGVHGRVCIPIKKLYCIPLNSSSNSSPKTDKSNKNDSTSRHVQENVVCDSEYLETTCVQQKRDAQEDYNTVIRGMLSSPYKEWGLHTYSEQERCFRWTLQIKYKFETHGTILGVEIL